MSAIFNTINGVSTIWTGLVWAVVWQWTVLVVVVAVLAWCLRRSSPAVRYWLWQILAIKLLLMPFWTVAVPFPWLNVGAFSPQTPLQAHGSQPVRLDQESPPIPALPTTTTEIIPSTEPRHQPGWLQQLNWQTGLFAIWLAVIVWQTVRLVQQRIRLARLLRAGTAADEAVRNLLEQTRELLQLRRAPRVVMTAENCSPFVCGIRSPVLVLPAELTRSLHEAELRPVLLHELAHIKRRDLLWGWIPELARVIYFFHPVVHGMNSRIRLERELACDQLALLTSGTAVGDYAETLVKVVTHAAEPAALKTAAATSAGLDGREALPGDAAKGGPGEGETE